MNEELKTILGNSIVLSETVSIPVAHLRYKGSSKTFVTWTIISEAPSLSAYDEDLLSIGQVDIDIFSDSNYLDIVSKVKELMNTNDWLWVEDSVEMYEEDTELYHRTITFEKERSL